MASGIIQPKAVLCDVFGTVVNWRLTVTESLRSRAASTLSSPTLSLPSATRLQASTVDWSAFAQKWRDSYWKFTQNYTASTSSSGDDSQSFKTVDQHHHDSLISLLDEHQLHGLWSEDEIKEISLIWHFLIAWPDSTSGLERIKKLGIPTCALSNGNNSLLADMAAFAHLPWSRIFSSEQFGAYKPAPQVYNGAVKELGLEPGECTLIAAHLADLKAARECGLRTIYVERENEDTWSKEDVEKARVEGWTDLWVGLDDGDGDEKGLLEVARRLTEWQGKPS
ncbi:hypothetical protein MMC26_005053 [Xylographa opegraphella]|nr:hypothetical protein [Xylographa opegraphella]